MTRRRGWTLMELLAYMLIGSAIVGTMFSAVHQAYDLLVVQRRALEEVHSSARLQERISADVRSASKAVMADGALVLESPDGKKVYSYGEDGGLWRIASADGVEVSRQAFPFALEECSISVDGSIVTVNHRRRNVESRLRWTALPQRSFSVSTWVEE